jgi:hypothetical protein
LDIDPEYIFPAYSNLVVLLKVLISSLAFYFLQKRFLPLLKRDVVFDIFFKTTVYTSAFLFTLVLFFLVGDINKTNVHHSFPALWFLVFFTCCVIRFSKIEEIEEIEVVQVLEKKNQKWFSFLD